MKNTQKNALSGVGIPNGAMETAALTGMTFSKNDSTTSGAVRQPLVSDFLCRGRENGRTMRELRQILNGDSRSIRLQIEHERRQGVPIVSDCQRGYWLAETRAEIEGFVRSMRARAREIQKTAALVQLASLDMGEDDGG